MISRGIKSIPLIFGSTMSSTVVMSYPGNLFHFITAKDLVSPYFLGSNLSSEEIVGSASSVAVVAMLALHKLGFSPIILVGQNLAYKDQRYYSSGVDYNKGSDIIESDYFEHLYKVPSVDGGYVYSDDGLNCFRKDMEAYIRNYGIADVINTTRNGAIIKGTVYMHLDELLKKSLKDKIVDRQWEQKLMNKHDKQIVKRQASALKVETEKFYKIINSLKALSSSIYTDNSTNAPDKFAVEFYRIFNEIITNKFFHVFLYSMNVYECKLLIKDIRSKNNNGPAAFSFSLFDRFIEFINTCLKDMDVILPLIEELNKQLS
jgi:hypothetical protein